MRTNENVPREHEIVEHRGRSVADVVGEAIRSWQPTLRLCLLLIAAAPAAVVAVFVLVTMRL